jgi:serine/threonine protein kinase
MQNWSILPITSLLNCCRARLCVGSPVPWKRVVEIGAAIATGLATAHDAGVIHRDTKPENIFLTSNQAVKILDVGLAQLKRGAGAGESGPQTATLSGLNLIQGTAGYMAPEQIRCEEVSTATDLFSLACVLFELITGRRAFQGTTSALSVLAILNDEPQWRNMAVAVGASRF